MLTNCVLGDGRRRLPVRGGVGGPALPRAAPHPVQSVPVAALLAGPLPAGRSELHLAGERWIFFLYNFFETSFKDDLLRSIMNRI